MKENINENERSSQSQESLILDHMLRGHRITGMDALNLFGCFRLPARIADLKERGFRINSEFVTAPSGKKVKAYWI